MQPLRTVKTLLCILAALVFAAATNIAVAQNRGCAGGSHNQISRQLARAKLQASNAGCTGFFGLFQQGAICPGLMAQVRTLEARLRQVRQQPAPQFLSNSVLHFPSPERVVVPDCGRSSARAARVVCVRLCDGYFFPVNHSIKQKNLAKDEQKCFSQYPEGQAALYIDRSGGENLAAMVSLDGKLKYGDQPFAFAFQQRFDPSCPRPGAHLAEAARTAAASETATLVRAAIATEAVPGLIPPEIRLVGPPYAYFFPDRGSGASALANDPAPLPHPDAATAVHIEIEKVSASGAESAMHGE